MARQTKDRLPPYVRLQGDIYHFRFQLPKDVRHAFRDDDGNVKAEIWETLKTSNRREAGEKAHLRALELKAEIRAIRSGNRDELSEITRRARQRYLRYQRGDESASDEEILTEALEEAARLIGAPDLNAARKNVYDTSRANDGYMPSLIDAVNALDGPCGHTSRNG